MIGGRRVVSLIPARAGSKGLTGKNLREVGALTLVGRAVASALDSVYVDTVCVSSEDQEILEEGAKFGAIAHERSRVAASDSAVARDVVREFLEGGSVEVDGESVLVYLQPTSPLRTTLHIDECLELLDSHAGLPVVSLARSQISKEKLVSVCGEGTLVSSAGSSFATANRQKLDSWWRPNGAIYAFRVQDFHQRGDVPIDGAYPYWMDVLDSIDIDSESDLFLADVLYKMKHA